tara:strand:- start:38 stop:286 length:249 start_codon:yes stop_codon:yes gene_type:complete
MAEHDSFPSEINADNSEVKPNADNRLYITSILKAEDLSIDGTDFGGLGPLELFSPIICDTFVPNSAGHVAYFQQGPIGGEFL